MDINRKIALMARLIVCKEFGLTVEEFASPSRNRVHVEARQMFCWLAKNNTRLSLREVGEMIGNRHHATIIHALDVLENLMPVHKQLRDLAQRLSGKVEDAAIALSDPPRRYSTDGWKTGSVQSAHRRQHTQDPDNLLHHST